MKNVFADIYEKKGPSSSTSGNLPQKNIHPDAQQIGAYEAYYHYSLFGKWKTKDVYNLDAHQ